MLDVSASEKLILDLFRVRGGREHIYTVPIFYGDAALTGLTLAPHQDMSDGYITHVHSGAASKGWYVDTAIREKWEGPIAGHLRVHGLPSDSLVLLGQGETRWGARIHAACLTC